MRICKRCKQSKDEKHFGGLFGHNGYCNDCVLKASLKDLPKMGQGVL